MHIIEDAIRNLKSYVKIAPGTNPDDIHNFISILMRHSPDIFWFSNQYKFDKYNSILHLKYNFTPQKRDFYIQEIENVITYNFQPDKLNHLYDLEKVAYVCKWLVNNCTYNTYSAFNQTIYSVLINRNSVCTGYAKTAQYLLKLVGVDSQIVFGKLNGDSSINGRHCWNIVKVNNEWYHVDFCLADPELKYIINPNENAILHDGLLWNFFCKSTDYILRNRSIESIPTYPYCDKSIYKCINIQLLKPTQQYVVCKSASGSSANIYLDSFEKNSVSKTPRGKSSFIDNEKNMLQKLTHCKHIIKLKGHRNNCIILEQLTPWSELLNSHYYKLNESQLKDIIIQLADGLIECRDRGIIYSDIHYNNVFVSRNGLYKWGDFGIAYSRTPDNTIPQYLIGQDGIALGSRWFMSPETYFNHIFKESSAIYSLAMLAYFVMNDMRPPFWKDDIKDYNILFTRLSGAKICRPVSYERYTRLAQYICGVLNSATRPDTLETFISDLNSQIVNDPDLISNPDLKNTARHSNSLIETDTFVKTMAFSPTPPKKHSINEHAAILPSPSIERIDISQGTVSRTESYRPEQSVPLFKRILRGISKKNHINASAYAPATITPEKDFIVRIFLHKQEDIRTIDSIVENIDENAKKKANKPLDIPIVKGDRITVMLKMSDDVCVDEPIQLHFWKSRYIECDFICRLPTYSNKSISGKAIIAINNIPCGELKFIIDVTESDTNDRYAKVDSNRYSRIFISYSHADYHQVKGIAEGCKISGSGYFFDRHTLKAGDRFKDEIIEYLDNADMFVLLWSKNSAESKWVQFERKYALKLIEEDGHQLTIYPLTIPPSAPLPDDMADKYNFVSL